MMTPHPTPGRMAAPDFHETKNHMLAAGREMLEAAHGAMMFCKAYAENHASPTAKAHLVHFFTRAVATADEFGKGLLNSSQIRRTAERIITPFFDAIGREMRDEAKTRQWAKTTAATTPASSRTAKKVRSAQGARTARTSSKRSGQAPRKASSQ